MKQLVAFYSRTGITKKVAEAISKILKCDSEEIFDTQNRAGGVGYFKSGRDSTMKKLTELKKIKNNPASYDTVIIGTPIWAWNVSTPIRTYLSQNKFNKVAFFCTMGGSGGKKAFREMERLCKQKPVAVLELKTAEVADNKHLQKVREFAKNIL